MSDPRERFAFNLWERVQHLFVRQERALGATWTEAYSAAWRHADEVLNIFLAEDRPLITLEKRIITT